MNAAIGAKEESEQLAMGNIEGKQVAASGSQRIMHSDKMAIKFDGKDANLSMLVEAFSRLNHPTRSRYTCDESDDSTASRTVTKGNGILSCGESIGSGRFRSNLTSGNPNANLAASCSTQTTSSSSFVVDPYASTPMLPNITKGRDGKKLIKNQQHGTTKKVETGKVFPVLRNTLQRKKQSLLSENFIAQFQAYAKQKERPGTGVVITKQRNHLWLKRACLIDEASVSDGVDELFASVAGTKVVLNVHEYLTYLRKIALKKRMKIQDVIDVLSKCPPPPQERKRNTSPSIIRIPRAMQEGDKEPQLLYKHMCPDCSLPIAGSGTKAKSIRQKNMPAESR